MSTIERMRAILFRAVAWPGGRDELLAFLQRDAHESSTEGGTLRFDVVEDPQNDHAFVGIVDVSPGVCLTIPLGTHFQFRAIGDAPRLRAVS